MTEMLTGIDLVDDPDPDRRRRAARLQPGRRRAPRPRHRVPDQRRGPRAHDFRPGAGVVERYHAPGGPGVRMDSHLYAGYEVPPFYDSLLGKLIVWGPDRRDGHRPRRASRSTSCVIEGLATNIAIHRALLDNETFLEGRMTTNLLDRVGGAGVPGRRGARDRDAYLHDSPPHRPRRRGQTDRTHRSARDRRASARSTRPARSRR